MRLASEQGQEHPLLTFIVELDAQNSRVNSSCVDYQVASIYFDLSYFSFQICKLFQQSSIGRIPNSQIPLRVACYQAVSKQFESPNETLLFFLVDFGSLLKLK